MNSVESKKPAPLATTIRKDRNMAMVYTVINTFSDFRQYTSRSVQSLCNVSPATAKRYLQELEKHGLIRRRGKMVKPVPLHVMSERQKESRKNVLDYGHNHAVQTLRDALEVVHQLSFLKDELE